MKLAVPLALGVPEIAKDNEPEPLDKTPAAKVAVNPVTPEEEIACAAYEPAFPPV